MHVCMLLGGRDFPPDIRVEKEALALRDAGHDVTILCDGGSGRPEREAWNGCAIVRVPAHPITAPLSDLVRIATLRDPRFGRALHGLVPGCDVLHVHDLPLAATALAFARRRRIPVILDLHENFPAALRSYRE